MFEIIRPIITFLLALAFAILCFYAGSTYDLWWKTVILNFLGSIYVIIIMYVFKLEYDHYQYRNNNEY